MKRSILAARQQIVIENIAVHAERLGAGEIDLISGIKGDADHKQLQMLERIDLLLANVGNTAVGFTLDDILQVDGLSKTSQKQLREALG